MSAVIPSRRGALEGTRRTPGTTGAAIVGSTASLLREGGDARLTFGAWGLRDKYGCTPVPDRDLFALGSSTASAISQGAFDAAESVRRRLAEVGRDGLAGSVEREFGRVRAEFAALAGIDDLAGLEILFGASGTDLHLLAGQFAAASADRPVQVIMMESSETGSGVPTALAGRHFCGVTALGSRVTARAALGRPADVLSVSVREADGSPRKSGDIDGDVERAVHEAIALGRRVLLILLDVSKTGMVAPSPALAARLRGRWPRAVDVLVDGCQFRLRPATLRAYLERGFMVAVTGSKFLGGPIFSGALLVPGPVVRRLRRAELPVGLSDYSAWADWPRSWRPDVLAKGTFNAGLLLRWEAALHELRGFRALPDALIEAGIRAFRRAVLSRLREDPAFEPLRVEGIDRHPLVDEGGWDGLQTIFPFLLYGPDGGGRRKPLNVEQTQRVYRLLQEESTLDCGRDSRVSGVPNGRYQLGQPVRCGEREGTPVSALRLCIGARLLVEMLGRGGGEARADRVVAAALTALQKASVLASAAL